MREAFPSENESEGPRIEEEKPEKVCSVKSKFLGAAVGVVF